MPSSVSHQLVISFEEAEKAIALATSLCEQASRIAVEAVRASTAAATATSDATACLIAARREAAVSVLTAIMSRAPLPASPASEQEQEQEPSLREVGFSSFAQATADARAQAAADAEEYRLLWSDDEAEVVPEPVPVPVLKPKRPNYSHPLWPSPRPRLFARALGYHPTSHQRALEILASRAKMSVEALLEMNPLVYEDLHILPRSGSGVRLDYRTRRELVRLLPEGSMPVNRSYWF